MANAPKRRVPAGPTNTSRGSGPAAPASVAARSPLEGATHEPPAAQSGFYNPESAGAAEAVKPPPTADATAFNDTVMRDHRSLGEHLGSADVEVLEHAAAEENAGAEDLAAAIERIRQTRRPLGAFSQKLALPRRPGYHRHWFNDVAGRIEEASANGWAHVLGTDKKPLARCVGSGRDKGALYAFAMEIPEVFWQEDQDAKNQAATDKIDSLKKTPAMASPGNRATSSDKGKFYDPSEQDTPIQIEKH